jgi:hypothetical protein
MHFHLRLFPWDILATLSHKFPFSPTSATCPASLIRLDLTALIVSGGERRLEVSVGLKRAESEAPGDLVW